MTEKWRWMMIWCELNNLHPGEKDNWKDAKEAYIKFKEKTC